MHIPVPRLTQKGASRGVIVSIRCISIFLSNFTCCGKISAVRPLGEISAQQAPIGRPGATDSEKSESQEGQRQRERSGLEIGPCLRSQCSWLGVLVPLGIIRKARPHDAEAQGCVTYTIPKGPSATSSRCFVVGFFPFCLPAQSPVAVKILDRARRRPPPLVFRRQQRQTIANCKPRSKGCKGTGQ